MRFSVSFFLVCWLAYFVVPMANSMGNTGEQRFQLCTTQGFQTFSVGADSASDNQPQPTNHSCPCTQYLLDTVSIPAVIVLPPNRATALATIVIEPYVSSPLPPRPRGPPTFAIEFFSRYLTS